VVYRTDTEWGRQRYTTHDDVLRRGSKRVESIAEAIEEATGATLEGRRALDFGCGVGRIAVPLAERCEHVYGLDLSAAILREAQANAERMNVHNLETMQAERLGELAGRYDLVISLNVLQHIHVPEGERIFASLLEGLRPGGVGFVNVVVRPPRPLRSVLRWTFRPAHAWRPRRKSHRLNPLNVLGVVDFSYGYMMRRSYSLNRLGRVLAEAGIERWQVHYNLNPERHGFDSAALVFAKP
jgi:2-polyprenyl-3-methyl-5-hydroxy-6-metoxy-1,4-benzoquinol methylase